ncbi:MAG: hypothetical protein ACJ76H_16575 [Bacteriovoracaceae bacterium]
MPFIFFMLFSSQVFALSKADFFPIYPPAGIIEERTFEKGVQRNLERLNSTYRYVANYEKLGKMPVEIARPVLFLSAYSICSMNDNEAIIVEFHYEPVYTEAFFRCGRSPDYDNAELRLTMKKKYCTTGILSKAQEIICKELMLN